MLICHCHAVNDHRIRSEIALGARTVAQVARACRAGSDCGGCARAVAEIIEETRYRSLPTISGAPTAPSQLAAE